MKLDRRSLETEQEQRLRRARRTAVIVGAIAFTVFLFSIVQMFWLQHHSQARPHATLDSLMQ